MILHSLTASPAGRVRIFASLASIWWYWCWAGRARSWALSSALCVRLGECKHNSGIISLISPPLAAGLGGWLGARLGARCDGDLLGECQLSCHGPAGQQPNDHQPQGRGPSHVFYFLNQHDEILGLCMCKLLYLLVCLCLFNQSVIFSLSFFFLEHGFSFNYSVTPKIV